MIEKIIYTVVNAVYNMTYTQAAIAFLVIIIICAYPAVKTALRGGK